MQTLGIRQFALCTGEAYRQFSKDTQTQWRSAGVHFVKGKGMMEVYSVSSPNNRRNTGIDLSSSAETMRSLPSFLDLETNGALEPFDRPIENEGMFALNGSLPITSTTDIDVGDAAVRAVLTAFNPANGVFGSRRNRITPVSDTISATNLSKASVSLTDFLEVFDTTKPVTKAFSQKREKEKSVSSMTIEADKTVWPRRTSMTPPGWHRRTSMNPTWFKVPGFGIVKDVKKRKEGEKNASYAVMMAEPTMTKAAGFETLIEEFSDPWKHIGWLSLVFTDPDIWKRYRRYLRKDEEHRLRTLLLEGCQRRLFHP
ncbi:hypothetical protein BC829DRAFT_276944 [Chytridium lagenaria]|nr:hypothetical protein BC829DRAFT_276944 [Chytridium lagenaria]